MPQTAGELIARARSKKKGYGPRGMPQAELARLSGVGRSHIASIETNRTKKPRPQWLHAMAQVLDLDYRELLALTDQLGSIEAASPSAPIVASTSPDVAALVATVGRLVEQLEAERREWREERREWRALLDRLLPGGGATLSVEDDEEDSFEDSPLTEAGRAAGRLAHDDLTAAAEADPVTELRPRSAPRTPAGHRSR